MNDSKAVRGENRLESVERCLRLLHVLMNGETLERHGAAALLQCSTAAVDRYLRALLTFPGVTTQRCEGRMVLHYQRAKGPELTLAGMIARCLGASLAPLFRGSSYENALTGLIQENELNSRWEPGWFHDADRKFYFHLRGGEPATADQDGPLEDIVDAVLKNHSVKLLYQPFLGPPRRVRLRPYTLLLYEHQLYVMGLNGKRLRLCRLSRIQEVETRGRFRYPSRAEYDPVVALRDSIGVFLGEEFPVVQVVLRVDRKWENYLRGHRYHQSQQLRIERDGLRVQLRVRCCKELERFILQFGEEVEVLAPPELRTQIAARVQLMVARYAPQRVL